MWIFTSAGFVSAVEHRDDPDMVMVRARDKESLDTMVEGIFQAGKAADETHVREDFTIYSEGGSDYPWRVVVSKATFAIWTTYEILNYLNYYNFKNALTEHRGPKWHRAAMNVWVDMLSVEDPKDRPELGSSFDDRPYAGLSNADLELLRLAEEEGDLIDPYEADDALHDELVAANEPVEDTEEVK